MAHPNTTPRISAVITAYNCEPFIAEAIESVLAQTRPVDEIVVIDDGSPDNVAQVVARYADRGVRYVYQENAGPGAARNRGIRETSGDLVAFLDGDDMWQPERIAHQLAFLLTHRDVGMVSGHMLWWTVAENKRRIERFGVAPGQNLRRELLVRNVVGNPSMVLVWRHVLEAAGLFNDVLPWGQDWELWMRIAARAQIAFLDEPVIIYRWHAGGISHNKGRQRLKVFQGITTRAIAAYEPAWWRPILLARALSHIEYHRALFVVRQQLPRREGMPHALAALALNPRDDTRKKLGLVVRLCLGDGLFAALQGLAGGRKAQRQAL